MWVRTSSCSLIIPCLLMLFWSACVRFTGCIVSVFFQTSVKQAHDKKSDSVKTPLAFQCKGPRAAGDVMVEDKWKENTTSPSSSSSSHSKSPGRTKFHPAGGDTRNTGPTRFNKDRGASTAQAALSTGADCPLSQHFHLSRRSPAPAPAQVTCRHWISA